MICYQQKVIISNITKLNFKSSYFNIDLFLFIRFMDFFWFSWDFVFLDKFPLKLNGVYKVVLKMKKILTGVYTL